MKKVTVLLSFSFAVLIIFNSCANRQNYRANVTVIGKSKTFFAKADKVYAGGNGLYLAVTKSGDTVPVRVPEKIAMDNQCPYEAVMVKSPSSTAGRISTVIHRRLQTDTVAK